MRSLLILLLLFVAACGRDIVVDEKMNGISETEVLEEFGAPEEDFIINITKDVPLREYQSDLYNVYPQDAITDTVKVKELHWYFRNGDQLAIWLEEKRGQWIVVDNLRWSENIRF